jgi:hypothetical protein
MDGPGFAKLGLSVGLITGCQGSDEWRKIASPGGNVATVGRMACRPKLLADRD